MSEQLVGRHSCLPMHDPMQADRNVCHGRHERIRFMFRIFIGWDSRFPEPADVLRYSLLKHASIPLEIRYLKLDGAGPAAQRTIHWPRRSSPTRDSCVPHLCNFQGTALFLDNDMLCLADIREIAELDMRPYALRVVQHDYQPTNTVKMYGAVQTAYPRKNWSSMMLMDCAKLKLWSKQVVETQTGRLPAPLPGHSRRADRRASQDLEHARLDGRHDEAHPLHQRRPLVRAVPGPSARRHLVQVPRRDAQGADPAAARAAHHVRRSYVGNDRPVVNFRRATRLEHATAVQ